MSISSDYDKLTTTERRLVTKFVSALADGGVDHKERKKLIRSLRRACRRGSDEKDVGSRKNAYTYYYCEKFPAVKLDQQKQGLTTSVCQLAKVIAAQWKGLDDQQKTQYKEMAKASRSAVIDL
jgi:hypothetical protein